MKWFAKSLFLLELFFLFSTPAAWADASDIKGYSLSKFSTYDQSDVTTPSYNGSGGYIIIQENSPGSVPATPTVQFPGGAVNNFNDNGTYWDFGQAFGSIAALNAAWQSGGYLFTIPTTTAPATTFTPTLNTVAPVTTIPTITNTSWTGGNLLLGYGVANTIYWNANDAANYQLYLFGSLGDNVYLSGNASDQSVLISAGTLVYGETYNGELVLFNQTDDTTQVPGVDGIAQAYTQTNFGVVPEPVSAALLVGGLGLLVLVVKRKQTL